jgi:hypothetical protein
LIAEPLRVQVGELRLRVWLEPVAPRRQVQVLGECLGEPVGS